MTENQILKMRLLKELALSDEPKSVDFCREAYKFLTEGDDAKSRTRNVSDAPWPKDGIYIIFKDGQYKPFEKDADFNRDDVKYIGIVYDGHSFAIALKDLGEFKLVRDGVKCPSDHPLYRDAECEALIDWECIERTKHIQELGTDIPLADGEYIPSLPMLVVMRAWAKDINEALEFVGGEPFDMDSYYWSVTEYYSSNAWLVNFSSGIVNYYYKYNSNVVRPVAAFNL